MILCLQAQINFHNLHMTSCYIRGGMEVQEQETVDRRVHPVAYPSRITKIRTDIDKRIWDMALSKSFSQTLSNSHARKHIHFKDPIIRHILMVILMCFFPRIHHHSPISCVNHANKPVMNII